LGEFPLEKRARLDASNESGFKLEIFELTPTHTFNCAGGDPMRITTTGFGWDNVVFFGETEFSAKKNNIEIKNFEGGFQDILICIPPGCPLC
jgi:hypothetical protein